MTTTLSLNPTPLDFRPLHEFPDEVIVHILTEAANLRARHVCAAFNRCNPDVLRNIWNNFRAQATDSAVRDRTSAFFDVPMKMNNARFLPRDLIHEEMALIHSFSDIIGQEKLRIIVQLCNPPVLEKIAYALTPAKIVAMTIFSMKKLRARTDYFLYCILQEIDHPSKDELLIGKRAFEADRPEACWDQYKLIACNLAIAERYLDEMIHLGVNGDIKGLQVIQALIEQQFGVQIIYNLHGYIYQLCRRNGIETKGHRFFGSDALLNQNGLKIPIELKVQAIAQFKDQLLNSFIDEARRVT